MRIIAAIFFMLLTACGSPQKSTTSPNTRAIVAHGGGDVFLGSSSGIRLERAFSEPMRLAGGRSARIVTIASHETDRDSSLKDLLARSGYRNVYHLDVNDPQAVAEIARAAVIYFDGGVQTRLMRKLDANPIVRDAILARYQQGAVVGGVSAGAAALGKLMICCDRGGRAIPARGLGLLPNIVVDQHYTERTRQFRLDQIISANPNMIGVGVDEEMAAVFTEGSIRVIGSGGGVTLVRNNGGKIERTRKSSGSFDLAALSAGLSEPSVTPSAQASIRPNIIDRPIIIDANSALFCTSAEAVKKTISANQILELRAGNVKGLVPGCIVHRNGTGPYGPLQGRSSDNVAITNDGQQLFVSTTATGEFSYTFVGDK